jgi:hypothetical protein
MVVKFFKNRKGGSSKSVDYLLNEREQEGTARVLQGDPDLTRQMIKANKHKQKAAVGCLSFSEANIPEAQKRELMADFERTLLAGLERDQYNVLWVEHTDKGRLELNFVIPKIELTTGKALQPYYDRSDRPRIEMWQNVQNITNGFSNPQDPARAQTIQGSKKEIGLFKDYQALDNTLLDLVYQGKINNRDQIIELLEANGIEITRQNKDGLSVKLPESKRAKRLKGGIYSEQFTSIGSIETISSKAAARAREYDQRDTQAELESTRERLESYTHQKAQSNARKYAQRASEATKEPVEAHNHHRSIIEPSRGINGSVEHERDQRKQVSPSTEGMELWQDRSGVSVLHRAKQGEVDHDRIRDRAASRARARAEEQQRAIRALEEQREAIHARAREDQQRAYTGITGHLKGYAERVIERTVERVQEWARGRLDSLRGAFDRLRGTAEREQSVSEQIEGLMEQTHGRHLRTAIIERLAKDEQKQQRQQSYGMGMSR